MSLHKGPTHIEKENTTTWAAGTDESHIKRFLDLFAEKYCDDRGAGEKHYISRFMRSVKEAIAWARYHDWSIVKLSGSLELDEAHNSKPKATSAWHRKTAGLCLETLAMRQSNQGRPEEERIKACYRRTIILSMVPGEGDDDDEETRSDRIIR
jgi:hypothetical protein